MVSFLLFAVVSLSDCGMCVCSFLSVPFALCCAFLILAVCQGAYLFLVWFLCGCVVFVCCNALFVFLIKVVVFALTVVSRSVLV